MLPERRAGSAQPRSALSRGWVSSTVAAARRVERCQALADEVGGRAIELDVTDSASVDALASALSDVSVVIHSAGGALGLGPVADADEDQWRAMYETNVIGVERVTKALLPALEASGDGHIVVIGSVAGVEVYPGGGGYTAAKHAVNALYPHAQAGASRQAGPGHRDRPRHGRDGVLARPLRRRRGEGAKGLRGPDAADRRGRRRDDRVRRHAARRT